MNWIRGLGSAPSWEKIQKLTDRASLDQLMEDEHLSLDDVAKLAVKAFKSEKSEIGTEDREKIIENIKAKRADATEVKTDKAPGLFKKSFPLIKKESIDDHISKMEEIHSTRKKDVYVDELRNEMKQAIGNLSTPEARAAAYERLKIIKVKLEEFNKFNMNDKYFEFRKELLTEAKDLRDWIKSSQKTKS